MLRIDRGENSFSWRARAEGRVPREAVSGVVHEGKRVSTRPYRIAAATAYLEALPTDRGKAEAA